MEEIYLIKFLIAYEKVNDELKNSGQDIRFLDKNYILDKIKLELSYL
jgi:hypothetical protein